MFARILSIAGVCAVAALLIVQLFVPPVVGLANNGDFGKVIGAFGFGVSGEDDFKFAPLRYTFDPVYKFSMGYRSSEHLLAALAVGVNAATGHRDFDIRSIGFVHGALVLLAFALFPRRGIVITLGALLIYCDVLYVSALNSFYMDTAAYVFLLLAAAFYVRRQGWWLLAAGLLLVTSKTPHALLGLPLAGLFLLQGRELGLDRWKLCLAAAVTIAGVLFGWNSAGPDFRSNGVFSVVFFRLLPESRDVSSDLRLLGLNDSYRPYIGQHAFSANNAFSNPKFRPEFERRTSYLTLGRFYLRHPGQVWTDLRSSLAEAGEQRPGLGNFARELGLPEYSESHSFALWSNLKSRMFAGNGGGYLCAILLLTAAAVLLAVADRAFLPGVVTLVAFLYIEVLGSGLADPLEISRHFFLAHALEDTLLIATVAMIVRRVRYAWKKRGTG